SPETAASRNHSWFRTDRRRAERVPASYRFPSTDRRTARVGRRGGGGQPPCPADLGAGRGLPGAPSSTGIARRIGRSVDPIEESPVGSRRGSAEHSGDSQLAVAGTAATETDSRSA